MSLVCETIISEDELSQTQSHNTCDDEELDYEEEDIHNKDNELNNENIKTEDSDKDEGELEDDDDLEEGEVKEDEDSDDDKIGNNNRKRVMAPENSDNRQTSNNSNNNNNNNNSNNNSNNPANSVCRFFGRGQCTWGNACRFVHPTGGMLKRMPPPCPPILPMPPMPPHLPPHNRNRPQRGDFFENPPIHGPHHGIASSGSESAWERGLKQAKEMIVRASRRKEEEVDFEDKRFNLGVEDEVSRHSMNSRESSNSPIDDRYNDDEYERRRRLAFESAPWNNDEPIGAKLRSAEIYRDPWRRSKSPPVATKFRRPLPGSRSESKRSHSMSSISASGSDSSEFSGSEGSSFSESSASNLSERSGGRKRFNRKSVEKKKDLIPTNEPQNRFNKKGPLNTNWNKTNPEPNREYDSWSESLSESESISSYYSGSNSDSEVSNKELKGNKRIPKRTLINSKKETKVGINSLNRKSIDQSDGPPNKKNKLSAKSGPLSPLLQNKSVKLESMTHLMPEKSEPFKKSPIKMTFMKKHSTLKKDNTMAVKLNGGKDNEEQEEILAEEEEDSFQMSPGLSPKPVSKSMSSSPVSPDISTQAQQQQTSSSSSSGGSSKHDKHDKHSLLATVSRREELLQQLKAVEDAIARKRSKIN